MSCVLMFGIILLMLMLSGFLRLEYNVLVGILEEY